MNCIQLKKKVIQMKKNIYKFWLFIKDYNLEWGMKWDDYD